MIPYSEDDMALRTMCEDFGLAYDPQSPCMYCTVQVQCVGAMGTEVIRTYENIRTDHHGNQYYMDEVDLSSLDDQIELLKHVHEDDLEAAAKEVCDTVFKTLDPGIHRALVERVKREREVM